MKHRVLQASACAAVIAALVTMAPVTAGDDRDDRRIKRIRAHLTGFSEVTTAGGAISTDGVGLFRAEIDEASQVIRYTLKFTGLTGTVTQSHLHLGQHHTTGGISAWLCQTSTNAAPMSTNPPPTCMPDVALEGTITPENVIGPSGQGIASGEFDELVAAIHAGVVYANVHSSVYPPGEIRGQVF